MLSFLRGPQPPRTRTTHLNAIPLDLGRNPTFSTTSGILEFYPGALDSKSTDPMLGADVLPVGNVNPDGLPSLMEPNAHYHLFQDEHFKVVSGRGIWSLWGGREIVLEAGETITVPARRWHKFRNHPDSDVPLRMEHRYERPWIEEETRFFRNILCYLDDCRKADMEPSKLQLLVFASEYWTPIAMPFAFGGERLNVIVATVVLLVGGWIGKWIFGYKSSYDEYYDAKAKAA